MLYYYLFSQGSIYKIPKFNYYELARDAHKQRITPIFEFIAPDNRIVISYEEPKLILLALRNNLSGMYYSLDMMKL